MSLPLTIEEYSEKAFVVRGDTKAHKETLMAKRGRYNPNLRGGPGWVFSKRHLENITAYISETSEMKEKEKDTSTGSSPYRKRKRVVNLEQYRKKLRKIIKKEVEQEVWEEFEEQKPFVLAQWRNEFYVEKKSVQRSRCFCTVKQLLVLFIFLMTCLLSLHLGKDAIKEYVLIGWAKSINESSDGVWCQVYNITVTIPRTEVMNYKLFNRLSYPCW
jgi:hypothetical protein